MAAQNNQLKGKPKLVAALSRMRPVEKLEAEMIFMAHIYHAEAKRLGLAMYSENQQCAE